jgi:thiamine-phosphate pyrophosphorylase
MVQYRNKTAAAALRLHQAGSLKQLCAAHGIPLIVNDDIELAAAVGAHGVHLGRDDAAIEAARSILGAQALVGVSCYNELPRALDAQRRGADYVAFGSFFVSTVKPGAVRASIALLKEARAQIELPIVAIGGITVANAGALVAAGANALAVISAVFGAPDIRAAAQSFESMFACSPQSACNIPVP